MSGICERDSNAAGTWPAQRCARVFAHFAASAALLVLAACMSAKHARSPPVEPAPVPSGAATDASYDWHVLVLAPFGMSLKESPLPLHEVLLFHDETHGAADAAGKDCYAADSPAPRFVGQQPDRYLLCFDHDRLQRIEASVRLPAAEAQQEFDQACALWLKATAPAPGDHTACDGSDGSVTFAAHLVAAPGEAAATLSMVLSVSTEFETAQDPVRDAPQDP
jgi:hypothetical protein